MASDFAFLSVRELGRLLRAGDTSPTELTRYFLNRLSTLGPTYNAVATMTTGRALREAQVAEAELRSGIDRGPLHGIPYGMKDLMTAQGYPTTWGGAPFKDQRFDFDATVVAKLHEAGAILIGKLATVELAGGMGYTQPNAAWTGPGRNAWNRDFWGGGSSSGSGAAVGAGLVPFAIGSETWGSIVTPAHNNGVSGIHGTFGRVSRHGAMALSWSMDKIGPLARTADDCGLVLAAISGADRHDPSTVDRPIAWPPATPQLDGFKLATFRGATRNSEPDIVNNFKKSIETLRRIGAVDEIDFPDLPFDAVASTIIGAEASAAFDEFIESGAVDGLTAPEDHIHPLAYDHISAKDYLRAIRLRRLMVKEFNAVLAPYDAVVVPTRHSVARALTESTRYSPPGGAGVQVGGASNVCGTPAISVPNGSGQYGLPTGLEFNGAAFTDERVLQVAHAFQQITDWHTLTPKEAASR